jgi:hypothetical protein
MRSLTNLTRKLSLSNPRIMPNDRETHHSFFGRWKDTITLVNLVTKWKQKTKRLLIYNDQCGETFIVWYFESTRFTVRRCKNYLQFTLSQLEMTYSLHRVIVKWCAACTESTWNDMQLKLSHREMTCSLHWVNLKWHAVYTEWMGNEKQLTLSQREMTCSFLSWHWYSAEWSNF